MRIENNIKMLKEI